MRKALFLIVLIGISMFIAMRKSDSAAELTEPRTEKTPTVAEEIPHKSIETKNSVFIPYWDIPSESVALRSYDQLIYFGVSPDENGVLVRDAGYKGISSFIDQTPSGKERFLTVKMTNTDINTAVLEDGGAQRQIIDQTIDMVGQYGFDGIVLDLEMGVLPFEDTAKDIISFVQMFSESVHDHDGIFLMTVYGDTYYRGRPYNIASLQKEVDGFLIMAYDFHKSRGEPGPNFPLERHSVSEGGSYRYSFKDMIEDFTRDVPSEKLTVIFGMYGYDWTLGPQGLPLKAAKAIPLYQIDSEGASVDPISKEKNIQYTDDDGYEHVLWYEDEESAEVKIKYLQEQGIGSVGYWVWGYY